MYCNKCGESIKNNTQVCPYCGSSQHKSDNQPNQVDFSQFQSSGSPSIAVQKSDDMPSWYYTDSRLLLFVCLFVGIVKIMIGVSNDNSFGIYRGVVACASGLIFMPGVTVGVKHPAGILAIKIVVAAAVMIFI